ncbi:Protein of unknown function [Gryllus bimaculatus]|nr:Protein of unknown function [Gryllus bimaculatus]
MNLPPGAECGTVPAASGGDTNSTNVPHQAIAARDAKVGCVAVESSGGGRPVEGAEIPAAHRGPLIANPLSAAVNSLPRSQILTTPNSTLQKGVNEALQILFLLLRLKRQHLCDGLHTESIAATTYTLATTMTASAAAATTITTATGTGLSSALSLKNSVACLVEMMHLGGMLAGMHPPMPIHQIPVPFMAAGIPGLGWPVCPPAGKIPPQYECANHRISAGASASVTGTGFAVLHLHPSEELNWVSLESDSAAESSLLPTAVLPLPYN